VTSGHDKPKTPEAALAEKLRRVVPALVDVKMRAPLVASELDAAGPLVAALALDIVAALGEQADPASREVMAAILPLLGDPSREPFVAALRKLAEEHALLSLSRLLRRKQKGVSPREKRLAETRGLSIEPGGRPLSLGERRALARRPSRAILDKLLADPHPLVIRNLLANPRLSEDDVIRMAARRPALRDVIVEIARSPSWMARARVRMAVVLNPGTPTELSVPVLSQLLRPELVEVAESTLVPSVLRSAALDLLARRPPPPPDRMGGGGELQ